MTVSSTSCMISPFILILVLNFVRGRLTPNGTVSVDCGSARTFTCNAPGEPIKWTTSGLRGISQGPFLARIEAIYHLRMTSPDTGGDTQTSVSKITISGFSRSDDGGSIQCVNANNISNVLGMASISVDPLPLPPPTNVTATVESCDSITLQWDQPSEPNDITTSVSCTPPSPGCAECTTSPCNITGLNPSTEYAFTVTLNSGQCRMNMSTTTARTMDTPVDSLPSSLAALVLIPEVLLIPLIYPLGALIAKCCYFRDKSYCEVFWCCGCCRKDKSARYNSTELMESPHPGEEEEHQNASKGKHTQFVTDGEENKDQRGNTHKYIGTYATVGQLGDVDGDDITDETFEQQGYEDWIQYTTLDFSDHSKGNINVHHSITDDVTYAAV